MYIQVIPKRYPIAIWKFLKKTPSEFLPDSTFQKVIGFSCPRCNNMLDQLDHSEATDCISCGLEMQLFGNRLHIWGSNEKEGNVFNDLLNSI